LGQNKTCRRIQWSIDDHLPKDILDCLRWTAETRQPFLESFSLDDPHQFNGYLGKTQWNGMLQLDVNEWNKELESFFNAYGQQLRTFESSQLEIGSKGVHQCIKVLLRGGGGGGGKNLTRLRCTFETLSEDEFVMLAEQKNQWQNFFLHITFTTKAWNRRGQSIIKEWNEQQAINVFLDNQQLLQRLYMCWDLPPDFQKQPKEKIDDLQLRLTSQKHLHLTHLEFSISTGALSFDTFWNFIQQFPRLQSLCIRLVSHTPYGMQIEDDPQTQRFLTTYELKQVQQAWPHHLKYIEFDLQWDFGVWRRKFEGFNPTQGIDKLPNRVLWIKRERIVEKFLGSQTLGYSKEIEQKEPGKKLTIQEITAKLEDLERQRQELNALMSAALPDNLIVPLDLIQATATNSLKKGS
jgi:hypothetical protein